MKRVLITGANGFVGRALCKRMSNDSWDVIGIGRESQNSVDLSERIRIYRLDLSETDTDISDILEGVDVVVHCAARVHVLKETARDPLAEFRIVNTDGTKKLACQAAVAGVKRFVFMSTIGVNGDCSGKTAYTENDRVFPRNPYSISKYEAEKALLKISRETGIEVVITRAPLVYGPGNPGNFLSLLRIVSRGIPLPLASVSNKRSLIFIGNLVDALATCVSHPVAAGKTYLVSDREDVSTPELIIRVACALGKTAHLFPFPPVLIRLAGVMTGKTASVNRLLGSLAVDCSRIGQELDWKPPFTMEQGLHETAEWYRNQLRADG